MNIRKFLQQKGSTKIGPVQSKPVTMREVQSLRRASIGLDQEATQKPGPSFVFSARTQQRPIPDRRHDVSLVKRLKTHCALFGLQRRQTSIRKPELKPE
jgi:hypothetical protein